MAPESEPAVRRPVSAPAPLGELVVFADDWGHHPSSAQRLIERLLGSYQVLWVNTIGTRRPTISGQDLARAVRWMRGPRRSSAAHQQLERNPGVITPVMWPGWRAGWECSLNAKLLSRAVNRELAARPRRGRRVALTTLPITAPLIGRLAVDRWVYYCVDDYPAWPGVDGPTLRELELQQIQAVDRLMAVSRPLQQHLARSGRVSTLLSHGVDLPHWRSRSVSDLPVPIWWQRLERPILLFWGLVDRRLDLAWCRALATRGTLLLVGPEQSPDPRLREVGRTVRPGAVSYNQLPALAAAADLLVLPYAQLPVTLAMEPLKFKEYLATDRPVVARRLPALGEWSDAADLVETVEELVQAVDERLASGLPVRQKLARGRLAAESWESKAQQLAALIQSDESTAS